VLAALLLLGLGAVPAGAHTSDPRIVTSLEEVTPPLPDGVVVQVQASLAAQLVADNPTTTPLEVLGLDGRPFLRLSAAGVEADVTHPDFLTTSSPSGAAPRTASDGRPPSWVRISSGTSWGWFDHRLHPTAIEPPGDVRQRMRLGSWAVPLRYGDQEVEVRGSVDLEPLLGAFVVTADPAPPLVVQALPGKLPGLFLSNPERRPLTVLGRGGEPFLRFGPAGVEVNTASRTHVEDRRARGEPADPPSPEPRFEVVDATGSSYTWLDSRLRYPDDLPPDDVLAADGPTVVSRWEVPVEGLAGTPALTGDVRWEPQAATVAAGRAETSDDSAVLPAVLGVLAAVVLGGAVVALRRRS
jgi:hypothetical protein